MAKEGQIKLIDALKTGNRTYIHELFFGATEGESVPLMNETGDEGLAIHYSSSCEKNLGWLSIPLVDEQNNKALPIHFASKYGQLELVQLFLAENPRLLNARDTKNDYTPICYAALHGHTLIVEYLFQLGADLTIIFNLDRYGFLSFIGRETYLDLQSLIGIRQNRYHLIHLASQEGQLETVKVILKYDRSALNLVDFNGQTALIRAASKGHESVVDYLANEGADLNIRGIYTALEWAVKQVHQAMSFCLIRHGSDTQVSGLSSKYQLIHCATENGWLDVVDLLVRKDPSSLNSTTDEGMTPLHFAASIGHEELIEYFIAKEAQLNLQVNELNPEHYGKTALDIAVERRHFKIAKCILLKIIANQTESAFPTLSIRILDLLIAGPDVAHSLLQEPKILNLVARVSHITEQSILWYKLTERRPSWLAEIDRATGNSTVFKPVEKLAEGSFGMVRLFRNQTGQILCVKSLHDKWKTNKEHVRDFRRESIFTKIAYPENKFVELFIFNENDDRHVMDYITGERASTFMPKISHPYFLAQITLLIAQELNRIHQLGIVHGDFHGENIMIHGDKHNKFTIHIVDFGYSTFITDDCATLFGKDKLGSIRAPELCNGRSKRVKPNPNQDVFALGVTLARVFKKTPSTEALLYEEFSSITSFILKAQSADPLMRPTLESFCCELSDELKASMDSAVKYLDSILIRLGLWSSAPKDVNSDIKRCSLDEAQRNQGFHP